MSRDAKKTFDFDFVTIHAGTECKLYAPLKRTACASTHSPSHVSAVPVFPDYGNLLD